MNETKSMPPESGPDIFDKLRDWSNIYKQNRKLFYRHPIKWMKQSSGIKCICVAVAFMILASVWNHWLAYILDMLLWGVLANIFPLPDWTFWLSMVERVIISKVLMCIGIFILAGKFIITMIAVFGVPSGNQAAASEEVKCGYSHTEESKQSHAEHMADISQEVQSQTIGPEIRFCRHCGNPIVPGMKFCSKCGKQL